MKRKRKRNILLVEDEEAHARLILRIFSEFKEEFKISWVKTIKEAKDLLKKNDFSAIIADYYLPNGDGLGLIGEGKKRSIPVIILTSYGSERLAVRAIKTGAADYIPKSIGELYRLPQVVEKAIEAWNTALEKERIEKAFYLLLESMDCFAYILDRDLRYLYATDKARERLKIRKDKIIAKKFDEFHSKKDTGIFKKKAKEAFESGEVITYDFYDESRNVFLRRKLIPIGEPPTKKISYLLVVSEDVSLAKQADYRQKKIEKREKELTKKIKEMERLKGGIISNVSHELKTPVTIIKSSLELAMKEKNEKERRKILEIAMKALNRQLNIINKLMRMAEIETEKFEIHSEPIDLKKLTSSAIEEIYPLAQIKGIEIQKSLRGDLKVKADKEKIYEVLINLLENAVKYNKKNGKIFVKAESKKDYVEVSVEDTGIGIRPENLNRIFEKFYQERPRSKEARGGAGLGLAIVKEILEAHKGAIWVESEYGKGSKFIFTLPKT